MSENYALFRAQVASLKLDKGRLRMKLAHVEIDHWALMLAIKEWESRTGLDHKELLKGVYGKPFGILTHEELKQ